MISSAAWIVNISVDINVTDASDLWAISSSVSGPSVCFALYVPPSFVTT